MAIYLYNSRRLNFTNDSKLIGIKKCRMENPFDLVFNSIINALSNKPIIF